MQQLQDEYVWTNTGGRWSALTTWYWSMATPIGHALTVRVAQRLTQGDLMGISIKAGRTMFITIKFISKCQFTVIVKPLLNAFQHAGFEN